MSYNENEMTNETYEPEYSANTETSYEEPSVSEDATPSAADYSPFNTANEPVQSQPQENIKSNLAAGLVGAFLGSLIGCALWILIWRMGYIAGIAGFVIGVCALKGYEKLGKTLDIKGAIVTVILMIVMIFLANKLAWSWDAYDALKDYGWTFFDVFRNLDYIMEESAITSYYYKDLVIGYFLTALSSFKLIIGAFGSAIKK